jgi:hypothetical protein
MATTETKKLPADTYKWFQDRLAEGEVAQLIGGHPGDRTQSIQPSDPQWEGDSSWPLALGYPWVRWDEPYIGNQPKVDGVPASRGDNTVPVEMGKQPTLVANLPWQLRLIGHDYQNTGCAMYVRVDVYGGS